MFYHDQTSISNLLSLIKFNEVTPLKRETKEFLTSRLKSDKFVKKQIIYEYGDTCDRIYVIKKGLVRGYYTINNQDITTWLSIENEIFTSISGFFSNATCEENIECLEDTYVDYLDYTDMAEALNKFPDFVVLNRKLMEEYYYYAEIRSIIPRIPKGKERLDYFLKYYNKEIIRKTPKKYLASLLNLRPETLSRLINKIDFKQTN